MSNENPSINRYQLQGYVTQYDRQSLINRTVRDILSEAEEKGAEAGADRIRDLESAIKIARPLIESFQRSTFNGLEFVPFPSEPSASEQPEPKAEDDDEVPLFWEAESGSTPPPIITASDDKNADEVIAALPLTESDPSKTLFYRINTQPKPEFFDGGKRYRIEEVISGLLGEPVNSPYCIKGSPRLSLNNDDYSKLFVLKPFASQVWKEGSSDLGTRINYQRDYPPGHESIKTTLTSRRYNEGVPRTESSLFAACISLADTPSAQAQLYKLVAGSVVNTHLTYPELLGRWLDIQKESNFGFSYSFLDALSTLDVYKNPNTGEIKEYPEHEKLLVPESKSQQIWDYRLDQLTDAIGNDQLGLEHFRFIEFLSFSVNIDRILEMIQSQSSEVSAPSPIDTIQNPPKAPPPNSSLVGKLQRGVEALLFIPKKKTPPT